MSYNLIREAELSLRLSDVQAAMAELGYEVERLKLDTPVGKVAALKFRRLEEVDGRAIEVEFVYNPVTEAWALRAGPEANADKLELSAGYGADDMLRRARRPNVIGRSPLSSLEVSGEVN